MLTTISNVKLSTKQLFSLLFCFLSDEDSVQVPFPELSGESVEYLEQTSEAILALSNFRLFIRFKDSFVNVSFYFVCCYFVGLFLLTSDVKMQAKERKLKIFISGVKLPRRAWELKHFIS